MQFIVVCLLSLLLAVPLAAEQNVNPTINQHYQNPNVEQWKGIFEREGREIWDRREDILRALYLVPGQHVADVGSGTGFFTLMMARAVGPTGQVYAVDIAKNFVEATLVRAHEEGLQNVVGVVNDPRSVNLPANSVDLVFISDTYHHFESPQATLESIHAALRPGGEMVVIDFRRIPGQSGAWVMDHVRLGEQQARTEIEAMGFALVERLDLMRTQYFQRFRKRDD
ncbi:MAG: class I SAM-dependent methyltransferase [Gammaproteobacteria bacterium]|nr:class I SAM-dependent methyltransferase [Gammaproteobacteria bacterium]